MTIQAGDVLAETDAYTFEPWRVDLFHDALGEPKPLPDANLNPLFAYLVVQDLLDLPAFFAAASGESTGHRLLHGEVEVETLGSAALVARMLGDTTTTLLCPYCTLVLASSGPTWSRSRRRKAIRCATSTSATSPAGGPHGEAAAGH